MGILPSLFIAVAAVAAPERTPIPENLDAASTALDQLLPEPEKLKFKNTEESRAVTSAHFGIGRWIRNEWGLGQDSPLARYFLEAQSRGAGSYGPPDFEC